MHAAPVHTEDKDASVQIVMPGTSFCLALGVKTGVDVIAFSSLWKQAIVVLLYSRRKLQAWASRSKQNQKRSCTTFCKVSYAVLEDVVSEDEEDMVSTKNVGRSTTR